jgi:hypothetical protein
LAGRRFHLQYGKGTLSFQIPESQVLYELKGKEYAPLPDLGKAYRESLEKPFDSPPLRERVPAASCGIWLNDSIIRSVSPDTIYDVKDSLKKCNTLAL